MQNTKRGERLKFERVEPDAGVWLQAVGDYTDAEGRARRAAISLGRSTARWTRGRSEAAKEAMQGVDTWFQTLGDSGRSPDFDLLIVCGFAFDDMGGRGWRTR